MSIVALDLYHFNVATVSFIFNSLWKDTKDKKDQMLSTNG